MNIELLLLLVSVLCALQYTGTGDDPSETEKLRHDPKIHAAFVADASPTTALDPHLEKGRIVREAVGRRQSRILTLVDQAFSSDPPRLFRGGLNEKIVVARFYRPHDLFCDAARSLIYEGIDFQEAVPLEDSLAIARVSHRSYAIFSQIPVAIARRGLDPENLAYHFVDSLGWKIRVEQGHAFAQFTPSDWY